MKWTQGNTDAADVQIMSERQLAVVLADAGATVDAYESIRQKAAALQASTMYSGGSRGTGGYVSRDDSTNPAYFEGRAGNPGGNATAVTTGANTELGGGGDGGGGASVAYGTGYASLNGYGGGTGGSGATGGVVVENVPNSPPTTPMNPQTTGNISGQSAITRWGASTDPDGDAITYTLEQRADGGAWAQVYQGPELQATYAVPLSGTYFQRRVKASDTYGNESGYALESEKLISYNQLPTISGTDRDLGEFQERLEFIYTVDDPDAGDVLTVTEKIDGITTKVYTATRNVPSTFDMSRWPMLTNGKHTLLIQLTDGKATVSRTVTFTRVEYRIAIFAGCIVLRLPLKRMEAIPHIITLASCNLALIGFVFSLLLGARGGELYERISERYSDKMKWLYRTVFRISLASVGTVFLSIAIIMQGNWIGLYRLAATIVLLALFLYMTTSTLYILYELLELMLGEDNNKASKEKKLDDTQYY